VSPSACVFLVEALFFHRHSHVGWANRKGVVIVGAPFLYYFIIFKLFYALSVDLVGVGIVLSSDYLCSLPIVMVCDCGEFTVGLCLGWLLLEGAIACPLLLRIE